METERGVGGRLSATLSSLSDLRRRLDALPLASHDKEPSARNGAPDKEAELEAVRLRQRSLLVSLEEALRPSAQDAPSAVVLATVAEELHRLSDSLESVCSRGESEETFHPVRAATEPTLHKAEPSAEALLIRVQTSLSRLRQRLAALEPPTGPSTAHRRLSQLLQDEEDFVAGTGLEAGDVAPQPSEDDSHEDIVWIKHTPR